MSKRSALVDTRIIYCGDCLDQLRNLPDRSVDLIYIDPPFNSNRDYEVFWGETREKRGFEDRHASTQAYLDFMRPRCVELARVLKPTGTFYFHCDWHANAYVRVMLDDILGANNFQSEIIWRRNAAKGLASRNFARNHDTIYGYGGGADPIWNPLATPYDPNNLDKKTASKYSLRDKDGRRYQLTSLLNPNHNRPNLTYEFLGVKRVWRWTKERMQAAYEAGLVVQPRPGGVPRFKRYLDKQQGRPLDDVWTDIAPLNSQAMERTGYPTQKPLELLKRIIRASTNEGDIILDAFCGCGTALHAAETLGRQWIGVDISPTACRVVGKRLRDECRLAQNEDLWRAGRRAFVIQDLPWTSDRLRKLPPFEFENWAVIALGGVANKAKVGDMGIDGRLFPIATAPQTPGFSEDEPALFDVRGNWYPVQVKQMTKVGRPDIDKFEAVLMRENKQKGVFVSFGYTSDAETEISQFFKRTGKVIVPLTVSEILDEQIAHRLV
jgi:DNA modification methylase